MFSVRTGEVLDPRLGELLSRREQHQLPRPRAGDRRKPGRAATAGLLDRVRLRAANSRNPVHFDGIEGRGNFLTHSKVHYELPNLVKHL